jgi:Spy/CpxP family protein refolding chaperone
MEVSRNFDFQNEIQTEETAMNRRAIVTGIAALGAGSAFAQTQQTSATVSSGSGLSHKAMSRYSSSKSFYKIPKNATKQAKYIKFFTKLLSLTPNQQTEAANIFATATASRVEMKANVKAARHNLGEAVRGNDGAGINKAAAAIGTLATQHHTLGANAQAAFLRMLTPDQQAKLNQFRS